MPSNNISSMSNEVAKWWTWLEIIGVVSESLSHEVISISGRKFWSKVSNKRKQRKQYFGLYYSCRLLTERLTYTHTVRRFLAFSTHNHATAVLQIFFTLQTTGSKGARTTLQRIDVDVQTSKSKRETGSSCEVFCESQVWNLPYCQFIGRMKNGLLSLHWSFSLMFCQVPCQLESGSIQSRYCYIPDAF